MPAKENPSKRVLVVEDEADLRKVLTYNLESAGYEVRGVAGGEEGLEAFEDFAPQVVLLDLMLPGVPGTEVCRRIRSKTDVQQPAIVMLTARGDEIDRVVGFELGADDYVVKPFSMRELLLRVNAMYAGHRAAATPAGNGSPREGSRSPGNERAQLIAGALTVDIEGHHIFVSGQEIHISILEMRLLVYLMEARGHVRSREQLLGDVWGYKPGVSTRTVDTHIKRLRDKLGVAGDMIETVRGIGYRFAEAGQGEPS